MEKAFVEEAVSKVDTIIILIVTVYYILNIKFIAILNAKQYHHY